MRKLVWSFVLVSLTFTVPVFAQTPPPPPPPIPPQPVQGPTVNFRVINEDGVGLSALSYPDPVAVLWIEVGPNKQYRPFDFTYCAGKRNPDAEGRTPKYATKWIGAILASMRAKSEIRGHISEGCMDTNGVAKFTNLPQGNYRIDIVTPPYLTNLFSSTDYVSWTHEYIDASVKFEIRSSKDVDAGTMVLKRVPVQMFYSRREVQNDPASAGLLFRVNFWVHSVGANGYADFRMTGTTIGVGPNGPVIQTGYDGFFSLPRGVYGPFFVITPYTDALEAGFAVNVLFQLLDPDRSRQKSIGVDAESLPKW